MPVKQIILSIHHELPIGYNEDILNQLYEREVRPFIRLFYARPEWTFAHYFCGESLQWLKMHHPEAISALNELVSRKQMELLGGSYYAALLPLLSLQDRTTQMVEMALALREYFGKKPHGAYLNGDIWEPSLVHSLKIGDLHYTFVDRNRFIAGGVASPGEFFLTEEMGKILTIFPFYRPKLDGDIDSEVEHILQIPCDGDGLLTLMTDAKDVNALERLLNTLQAKGVAFTLPSKVLLRSKNSMKPIPRVYLPATTGAIYNESSYFYRNELFKHFSIRLFHAKNIHTALSVRQIKRDKSRKSIAIQSVLRSQNHQFYWHHRYGGFHNALARQKAMHHLLQADQIVREAEAIDYGLVRADFDMDGMDEILYQSALSNAFVHARGAVLFVLDFFPSFSSLLNVFNVEHRAGYSRAFHDFFFPENYHYNDWCIQPERLVGGDFVNSVYELVEFKAGIKQARYMIERNLDETLLLLQKEYRFYPSMVGVNYTFSNQALGYVYRQVGIEINVSLGRDTEIWLDGELQSSDVVSNASEFILIAREENIKIIIESSMKISLWRKSVWGDCYEMGKHYQGLTILLLLPLALAPATALNLDIMMRMEELVDGITDVQSPAIGS